MTVPPDGEHRARREDLGAYVLGVLPLPSRTALEAHLAGCEGCRRELATLRPAADALRYADPDRLTERPAPPPDLLDAVLRGVRDERR